MTGLFLIGIYLIVALLHFGLLLSIAMCESCVSLGHYSLKYCSPCVLCLYQVFRTRVKHVELKNLGDIRMEY